MTIYFVPLVNDQELTGNIRPVLNIAGTDISIHRLSADNPLPDVAIDHSWHFERYGFNLPASDIKNYQLHYNAWKAFSQEQDDWCMIVEASVRLDTTAASIENHIQQLADNWDVFFPFDRLRIHDEEQKRINENWNAMMNPSKQEKHDPMPYLLGFPWGSSIYFLSKKGSLKLLEATHIKQRVDDEIVQLSIDKRIEASCDDVDWFNYMHQPIVRSRDRNKAIYHAITQQSRWTSKSKDMLRLLLNLISDVAEKLHIDLLLQGGTHLGYIRHGGLMPWDDDVDLGIEEKDLAAFLTAIDNIPGLIQKTIIEESSGTPFYKIWLENGEPIAGYPYTFPFVDVWVFNKVGNDLLFLNGIISAGSAQYPYEEILFENVPFKMVANSIEVLDARYRTWKKGIRVYSYHHSLERCEGFPLRVEITVDENGRMVEFI
jgi:GR25 family glycosyltransferase involved in LPS biosynthesis